MKKNIGFRILAFAAAVAAVAPFWACGDDDDVYRLEFATPALYFDAAGTTGTASYVSSNVGRIEVTTVPDGWSAEIDTGAKRVTVTAPASLEAAGESAPVSEGILRIRGYSAEGSVAIAALYVALADIVDYTSVPSNCYVVSQPNTSYRFDATRIPGTDEKIEPASVEFVWTTSTRMLQYLSLQDDGTVSFFAPADDDGRLTQGNALVAACDKSGEYLWCWHLWVADFDPEENTSSVNGRTFMARNLGAAGSNTDDNAGILASYGLYYQWGRPSPFPRPRIYNCASGLSSYMYNGSGSQVYMSVEEADGASMAYAVRNPLVFLTGVASWPEGGTWRDDRKTQYDPCPAGWRVPQSGSFDGLSISPEELAGELSVLRDAYGWTLTDGAQSAFFFAGGRRTYLDGTVVNMNAQEHPEPWTGFYWTSGLNSSGGGRAMFFELDTEDAARSRFEPDRELQLSNGLQIRCVRE